MTLTKTDLLVVQRGDTAYKTDFENLRDSVIDGLDISHRISIIADEDGQRIFYYYDENFTPDKVQVYLNGAFLDVTVYDIQADRLVLDVGAEAGDIVELIQPVIPLDVTLTPYERQTFELSGTQTTFNLSSGTKIIDGLEQVYLNGKFLNSNNDYSFAGNVITLNKAAVANDIVEVLQPDTVQNNNDYPFVRKKFAVTANTQRTFGFGGDTVVPGNELIFHNGVLLLHHGDYNISDRRFELNFKAVKGDVLEIITNNFVTRFPLYQDLVWVGGMDGGAIGITHGEWAYIPGATEDTAGLLTAEDKTKLNGIEEGAQKNVNADWSATSGDAFIENKPPFITRVDLGYKTGDDEGTVTNSAGRDSVIPAATETIAGLMTAKDKEALNDLKVKTVDLGYSSGSNEGRITNTDGTDATIPAATETIAGLLTAKDKEKLNDLEVKTVDLGYSSGSDEGKITNTDGTDAIIPAATETIAGLLTAEDKEKLNDLHNGVEKIIAGTGITLSPNSGVGDVTINCTVDQLEFGGSADVTSDTVPSTTFNAQPLAIADFYVNVGVGKFSAEWAAVTDNATTATDADPGDYLVYNGSTFEHIPSGTPPAADPNWIAANGVLEPVNKDNQVKIGKSGKNVSLVVTGTAESSATAPSDPSTTLTTKGYVEGLIPVVNNGTLTIKQGDSSLGTFSANQSASTTITVPSFPTIPTVGNGTLTIKQGDSSLGTFSANQSASTTITVPSFPDLSGYLTAVTGTSPITVDNQVASQPAIGINLSSISNIDNI